MGRGRVAATDCQAVRRTPAARRTPGHPHLGAFTPIFTPIFTPAFTAAATARPLGIDAAAVGLAHKPAAPHPHPRPPRRYTRLGCWRGRDPPTRRYRGWTGRSGGDCSAVRAGGRRRRLAYGTPSPPRRRHPPRPYRRPRPPAAAANPPAVWGGAGGSGS
eukprot:scaffold18213_cov65-Isochrysis_galbana.AAC.2